jgi:hypothetical protein
MSNLRELANAELDLVGAGAMKAREPVRSTSCNPIVTLIEDIIRLVEKIEGNNPGRAKLAA